MRWLIVALVVVLVPACAGGSSGSGEAGPQRGASDLATVRAQAGIVEPTATERAVRPTPASRSSTATAESFEQNPGYATDESLFDALIAPGDIATTWTFGGDDGIGVAAFCGGLAIEEQFEPIGWAYGSYSAVGGEWAEQWIVRLVEPDAAAAMEYARSALTCDEETLEREAGNDVFWDYEPLDISPIGDEIHALRVDITYENPVYTPMMGNIVFARQGEFVVVVLHYGFSVQPELTERMAEIAVARLELVRDSSV